MQNLKEYIFLLQQKNLIFATCGGMGLTGIILEPTIKLKKSETSLIREKTYCTKNLVG